MNYTEFTASAGYYKPLLEGLLPLMEGRPIEVERVTDSEKLNAGFRDGKLHIQLLDITKDSCEKLFAHELGHILAATPEELFKPNLGLTSALTPSASQVENKVVSWQLRLWRHFGTTRIEGRIVSLTKSLFGGGEKPWADQLEANLLSEDYSFESFKRNWDRVWDTIGRAA